jgi:hypothetical protein
MANATPSFAPRRARHPPRLGDQVDVQNLLDADRVAHEGRVPALSIVAITTWASRNGPRGHDPLLRTLPGVAVTRQAATQVIFVS